MCARTRSPWGAEKNPNSRRINSENATLIVCWLDYLPFRRGLSNANVSHQSHRGDVITWNYVISPDPDRNSQAGAPTEETRLLRRHMDRRRRREAGRDGSGRQIYRHEPGPMDGRRILPGDTLRVQRRPGQ